MSIFSKSQYTWLASSFRDEVYKIRNDEVKKKILFKLLNNIAISFEFENPNAFDKSRFLHNIYCAHDHKDNICPYGYVKQSSFQGSNPVYF